MSDAIMSRPEIPGGTLVDDRYLIQKVLGQGGLGRTYLALNTQRFNEPCVLKEFAPRVTGDYYLRKARALFEREAKILYHIEHLQIPNFFAYVESDGRLFLVQEFVSGSTYSELLRQRRKQGQAFSEAEVIDWLNKLLPVLSYIHQRGIIHRDISPDNIMLPADSDLPVLIDFGVGKQRFETGQPSDGNANAAAFVSKLSLVGKVGYAPNEQICMGICSPSSDLYALGVTSVVLLTCKEPSVLMNQHTLQWKWQTYAEVSAEFAQIINKLLADNPNHRYPSADEALWALNAIQPSPREKFSEGLSAAPVPTEAAPRPKGTPSLSSPLPPTSHDLLSHNLLSHNQTPRKESPISTARTIVGAKAQPQYRVAETLSGEAEPISGASSVQRSSPLADAKVSGSTPTPISVSTQRFTLPASIPQTLFQPTRRIVFGGVVLMMLTAAIATTFSTFSSQDSTSISTESVTPPAKFPRFALNRSLLGHTGSVWSVVLSPDENTVISGSEDQTIKIWDLQTGRLNQTISEHTATVRSVQVSSDGSLLISGGSDGAIKFWRLPTGQHFRTLQAHDATIWAISLHPDNQQFATASADHALKIWDLETGDLIHTLNGHPDWVFSAAYSPDGSILASAGREGVIKLWDVATGEEIQSLSGHNGAVRSVVFDSQGQMLASAGWDGAIKLWDVATGQHQQTLAGHTDRVVSVRFAPADDILISASIDQTIRVWNWKTPTLLDTLSGHEDWVLSTDISASGQVLVSGGKDNAIILWGPSQPDSSGASTRQ